MMSVSLRSDTTFLLTVEEKEYTVRRIEIPFREGVELSTVVEHKEIRVSDRGLGEDEALRLLRIEIEKAQ